MGILWEIEGNLHGLEHRWEKRDIRKPSILNLIKKYTFQKGTK